MTVGRLVLPALRWDPGSGIRRVMAEGEAALEQDVGGFILFGGAAEEVQELTAALARRADRPLLFAADLERGAGQQIRGLTEAPPPLALASLDDPEVVREAAARTASEARGVGVNWVLAPVADLDAVPDNPIVQTRSFGAAPAVVARHVEAWVEACQAAGCLATAKHYPGHGTTLHDSHQLAPVVTAGAAALAAADEVPFRAAITVGVAAIMTAHIRYPALDPSGAIATYSRPILDRLRGLGFEGLIVTDAMIMGGAASGGRGGPGAGEAAAAALSGGVDLVLYPEDVVAAVAGLTRAVSEGRITGEQVQASLGRYHRALEWVGAQRAGPPPSDPSASVADRILAGALARGTVEALEGPLELAVVDDDLGGPYPPGPSDWVERTLGPTRVSQHGGGGARVVLVFAEPRGWKGRAGLGRESLEALATRGRGVDLIVLFGHPRLIDQLPAGPPVLLAWHRQRLMQQAVGRRLLALLR